MIGWLIEMWATLNLSIHFGGMPELKRYSSSGIQLILRQVGGIILGAIPVHPFFSSTGPSKIYEVVIR